MRKNNSRKRFLDRELANRKVWRRIVASENGYNKEYCSGFVKKFTPEEIAEYEAELNSKL